jgi:hypothetical protein
LQQSIAERNLAPFLVPKPEGRDKAIKMRDCTFSRANSALATWAGFSHISHEEVILPLNPRKQPIHDRAVARWYSTAFAESIEPLCVAPFGRVHR